MQACLYCHKELDAKAKVWPHGSMAYPTGRPFHTFPAVIIAFLICWVICFFYLQRYAGTSDWLSVVMAIPILLLLFAGLIKLGTFCG